MTVSKKRTFVVVIHQDFYLFIFLVVVAGGGVCHLFLQHKSELTDTLLLSHQRWMCIP